MGKITVEINKNLPLIFLTGCINPDGMALTKIQDVEIRRNQYCKSIKFYLKSTKYKILFVENSGVDIASNFQEEIEGDRLEILTFNGNNFDKNLGKGFGEMLIIKYAFSNSSFIKHSNAICKITGRYKILNINSILSFYVNCNHHIMAEFMRNFEYVDSKLFIGTPDFYQDFLLKYAHKINDSSGFYFEHALCKAVLEALLCDFKVVPFKFKPRYSGQSGTDGSIFNHSFVYWFLRNTLYLIRFRFFSRRY